MIQSMTISEYAAYQREMGERVVESGGVYWRRVRPFFYRPLVPWQALDPALVKPPWPARFGAWQFVVTDGQLANSKMGFLVYTDADKYSPDALERAHRRQVRTAMKHFNVRPLERAEELMSAYEAYLDFQRRTRYQYRADRVCREGFDEWAESVFRHPKALVLGAFAREQIEAVAVCQRVGAVLIYASFFSCESASSLHIGSLMLHVVRTIAAESGNVRYVFAGMRKAGSQRRIDEFHLQRGCQIIVEPAWCELHPAAKIMLRLIVPGRLDQLFGKTWERQHIVPATATLAVCPAMVDTPKS